MNATLQPSAGSTLYTAAVILGPLLLLLSALLPTRSGKRAGQRCAQTVWWLATAALVTAGLAALGRLTAGKLVLELAGRGALQLDIYFDTISAVMLILVAFLGTVVTRYSCNYMDGDPGQARFSKWLGATLASVLTLIISGNLLMFTAAWVATSLCLHRLLTFYPERPAALLAARKKFLFSRLGDACLVGALILSWQCFGTWKFSGLFAAVEALRSNGNGAADCANATSFLLVAGALLKSAQFPFHSWLPDTMETPTPVSALMHAGIINAGGFLIVRLSPIIAASPAALNTLALVGAFTALFASVVMLTQTSVKRSLAYSTIAQMGFMMLQCGLGAFALALLHIVAHSLYKAHAFLSSGNIVSMSRSAWVPVDRPAAHPLILGGTLLVALALTAGTGALFHVTSQPGVLLLASVFMMAVAYLLWNLWSSSHRAALLGWGLLMGAGAAISYFALHVVAEKFLAPALPDYAPARSPQEFAVMILIVALFMAVLIFQSQLPSWSATKRGRALYVHASQGFYLGALANRLIAALAGKPAKTLSSTLPLQP